MHKKNLILLAILSLVIGFAAVATTLVMNGTFNISENTNDFDVYFSKAVENGTENNSLIKDKTHIEFQTELKELGETYILDYTITNGSQNYDANFELIYTGDTNEFIKVDNYINTTKPLKARETRTGKLVIELLKVVSEDKQFAISYEIRGTNLERDYLGDYEITDEEVDMLKRAEYDTHNTPSTYLGYDIDRRKVKSVTFMPTTNKPEGTTLVGDVGRYKNGDILMYKGEADEEGLFELYIGQTGGVKANPSSEALFYNFYNLEEIRNLEYLDTSGVTDMSFMFAGSGLTSLDVSSLKTSLVTNMMGMFSRTDLTTIDVSNFDTSNVTSMSYMFSYRAPYFIDAGETSFTEIKGIENFDTSKVKGMTSMFAGCKNLEKLDLSGFDTSNVTSMTEMFYNCQKLTTTITIRGTKCTSYAANDYGDKGMFSSAATTNARITVNYSKDASSLVDQMIATKKYSNCNVVKGEELAGYTIAIIDNSAVTANLSEACELLNISLSTSNENKKIVSFKMNGVEIKGNTFKMPAENVQITDVVEKNIKNTITIESDSEIEVSETEAEEGDYVNIYPKSEDYEIISYKINGKETNSYQFSMPDEPVVISDVVLKKVAYSVTIQENDDIYVRVINLGPSSLERDLSFDDSEINGTKKVYIGNKVVLLSISGNYEVLSFKMNGKRIAGNEFIMPETDVIVSEIEVRKISHNITIEGNDKVTASLQEAAPSKRIDLSFSEENRVIVAFKLNGTLIEGSSFTMPDVDVVITDVLVKEAYIIESEHNPYPNSLNDQVIGTKTFEGAVSLTIIIDYETESTSYDWIYLYDSTGKQYGKYGGARNTEIITIPGNSVEITLTTDSSVNSYYGLRACIIPNYES